MIIVTDSGVLGGAANPKPKSEESRALVMWALRMRQAGHTFAVPAIADYEVRRELVCRGNRASVKALDEFRNDRTTLYLRLTDKALLRTAQLWADFRNEARPTASEASLDGDVILMAQVLEANFPEGSYTVATDNLRHFQGRVPADLWQNILP